jgi:hypothetical protein
MANRRMFNKEIVNSDAFSSMPISSQALYFHLGMEADDDGFINNPLRVVRTINVSADDLKVLQAKRFIIDFNTGIIVIKHWRKNNQIRTDRYKETNYLEEASQLYVKKDGTYTLNADNIGAIPFMATKTQPNNNQWLPQYSVVKSSLVEISEVKENKEKNITTTNKELFNSSNSQDNDFMNRINNDTKVSGVFTDLERKLKWNFLQPKGRELTEFEARLLMEWIDNYPKPYLDHMISELSLINDDKKNFKYLRGAITKAYDKWLKQGDNNSHELDEIERTIKELEAQEKAKGNK